MKTSRRKFTAAFKSKVAIEVLKERETIQQIAARYEVHPTQISAWKRQFLEGAQEAFGEHGAPEIFNSDQGSQFSSLIFTDVLKSNNVRISMDGKGRAIDNIFIERLWRSVKYEYAYLNPANGGLELYQGMSKYMNFYNHQRPHQSLKYQMPATVFEQKKKAA